VAWVLYYPNAACSATLFGIILFSLNDRIYWARSGGLKLEGKEVPENILIRAQDRGFAYTMIKAYQGDQRDQF